MRRLIVIGTGLSCLLPLALAAVMLFVLLTGNTLVPVGIVDGLLIGCVLLWVPSMGYLIFRITKTDVAESAKVGWIVALVLWAPLLAPVVWYKFCARPNEKGLAG